ncbi:hypothetical protein QOT17_021993 [Balamuthia mandrillaris]
MKGKNTIAIDLPSSSGSEGEEAEEDFKRNLLRKLREYELSTPGEWEAIVRSHEEIELKLLHDLLGASPTHRKRRIVQELNALKEGRKRKMINLEEEEEQLHQQAERTPTPPAKRTKRRFAKRRKRSSAVISLPTGEVEDDPLLAKEAIGPVLATAPQDAKRMGSSFMLLIEGLVEDEDYDQLSSTLQNFASLNFVPPSSVYETLLEKIMESKNEQALERNVTEPKKKQQTLLLFALLKKLRYTFPPSLCSIAWKPISTASLESQWEQLQRLIINISKTCGIISREKDSIAVKAQQTPVLQRTRLRLYKYKTMFLYWLELFEEELYALVRDHMPTDSSMLYKLLHATEKGLSSIIEAVFKVLETDRFSVISLMHRFLYLISEVYCNCQRVGNLAELIPCLLSCFNFLSFEKKLSFLEMFTHFKMKTLLLDFILETNYSYTFCQKSEEEEEEEKEEQEVEAREGEVLARWRGKKPTVAKASNLFMFVDVDAMLGRDTFSEPPSSTRSRRHRATKRQSKSPHRTPQPKKQRKLELFVIIFSQLVRSLLLKHKTDQEGREGEEEQEGEDDKRELATRLQTFCQQMESALELRTERTGDSDGTSHDAKVTAALLFLRHCPLFVQ